MEKSGDGADHPGRKKRSDGGKGWKRVETEPIILEEKNHPMDGKDGKEWRWRETSHFKQMKVQISLYILIYKNIIHDKKAELFSASSSS